MSTGQVRATISRTVSGRVLLANGRIAVTVLPEKGADVLSLVHAPTGTEVFWRAPHTLEPGWRPEQDMHRDDSASFYDTYPGGLQEIFPNSGDSVVVDGARLPFHGEAARAQWSAHTSRELDGVRLDCATQLRRSPFELQKSFRLADGGHHLEITSTVTNRSAIARWCSWGFHPAFGGEFMTGDVRLYTRAASVFTPSTPFSPKQALPSGLESTWPEGFGHDFARLRPGDAGTADLLFLRHTPGWYVLANHDLGLAVSVTYPAETLPFLWLWQECRGTQDWPWFGEHHIVGIEPHSSAPATGLIEAVRSGRALRLPAAGRLSARITVGVTAFDSRAGTPDGPLTIAARPEPDLVST